MKLLHVITTLDVGGAEMHLLSQVRGQVARGLRVRVLYLKGEGTLADDFRGAGAERVAPVGPLAGELARGVRWADVVHSHLLKADVLTALVATLLGRRRRLLSGKHNDEQVLRRLPVSLVHGLVGNLPRVTVVLSDHVGRFVAEHGRVSPARIRRVYYGVDPAPFEAAAEMDAGRRAELRASLGLAADDVVFVCVARFAPQKAHDVLLKGFAEARRSDPRLRLLLVGGDPFGDGVERARALAEELQLGESVVFAGIRRDVPDLLAISDVFVMSSLWEGLGLVFLEAMATGIPVLATRVSAVPEVVEDGVTGRLVPPSDAGALADGFLELSRSPETRARMAQAGRTRVRDVFGIDRMVDETIEIYRDVVGPAGG